MKTITTTLNKLFIAMLSFVTMFVCAFTFPMHKASASTTVDDELIPDEVLIAYTERVIANIQLTPFGDPLCFLIDGQLFEKSGFTITETTTISDINDSPIIQTMAREFEAQLEQPSINPRNDFIDAGSVFHDINLQIIIHIPAINTINTIDSKYVNVKMWDSRQLQNYRELSSWNGYVTSSTAIFGMIYFPREVHAFYNLLLSTQQRHPGFLNVSVLTRDITNSGSLNADVYTWSELL